jgi:1-acyl-sn-glycerol-3-phosphate acyltransferase
MVIVFVIDNYISKTDGTNISAQRLREELIRMGHTVRVLTIGPAEDGAAGGEPAGREHGIYGLQERYIPLVSWVAKKSNMRFAKFNRKIAEEALTGADIVHLYFPFGLERKCLALAKKMGIPASAAFHCQMENITYNIGLGWCGFAAAVLYRAFKFMFYKKVENLHCPSPFIAIELKRHKYNARLHVISNGVSEYFKPEKKTTISAIPKDGTINVLMTGRLAPEKRQDLVINAVKHSKYRDRIQLYFAGKGPAAKKYASLAADLPIPARFEFLSQTELRDLIRKADIYVHASDIEIEGISCIEAIACGKVPIISDSEKSATSQFALDERSIFRHGNYFDLRDKLDYWIEHPEERERMGREYAHLGGYYSVNFSARRMVQLFRDAIFDFRSKEMIKRGKNIKKYAKKVNRRPSVNESLGFVMYYFFAAPLLTLFHWAFFGLKVKNKKVLRKIRKTGAITVCNHVHHLDSSICALSLFPRKPIIVSLPSNFNLKVAGFFVEMLGAVPVPQTQHETQAFIYTVSRALRQGRLVHLFPEGDRTQYGTELREFKRGAFYLAVDAQIPIVPMKIVYRDPSGLRKIFKKHPCLTLVLGDPIYPNNYMLKNEAITDMLKRTEDVMHSLAV